MRRLAIMQPYFFPYLGYFQLISAVDRFVFYDDVNYIRGGWINRNRINLGNKAVYITVPVTGASSFSPIDAVKICERQPRWREKMLKTLTGAYAKAPHFTEVHALVKSVLTGGAPTVAEMAKASIRAVFTYLGLDVDVVASSRIYENGDLRGAARVLDICKRESASFYLNAPGGTALYDQRQFADAGITLQFLSVDLSPYPQHVDSAFIPGLSIIDALMFNAPDHARKLIQAGGLKVLS